MAINQKTNLSLLVVLSALAISFILPLSIYAAEIKGSVGFDGSHKDLYNQASVGFSQYGSFVTGYDGKAFRSSHAGDDGSGTNDLSVNLGDLSFFRATGEMYVTWYVKYENYINQSHNVKWMKIARSGYEDLEIGWRGGKNFMIQYSGGGSNLSCGQVGVSEYFSAPVNPGDGNWHKVEIYLKRSSGSNRLNCDGVLWLRIDGQMAFHDTNVKTGRIDEANIAGSPSICGTSNQESGHGWWLIDKHQVWSGIPGSGPSKPTGFDIANP